MTRLRMMMMLSCSAVMTVAMGCAKPSPMDMSAMKAPPRAAELDRLEPLIGEWDWTMEMTMPGMDKPMTSKGTSTTRWACDRQVVIEEVTGSMGPDAGTFHGVSFTTWDPQAKKYRVFWYDNMGESEHSEMTYDDATKTFKSKGKGKNSMTGAHTSGEGWFKAKDANTNEWGGAQWSGWTKTMEMKGTSTRRKMM